MHVKIYKNFLSLADCNTLNGIARQGVSKGWVGKGVSRSGYAFEKRFTSRMHMGDAEYPQMVHDISSSVRLFLNIDFFPTIAGHGKDGVVVSYTLKGGDIYAHKDPRSADGLPTYRCNILTQASEAGGELFVDDKKIDIAVGDLHCYMVSELEHYATEVKGKTPRIMWMFGAHIPKTHWEEYGVKNA
jgi:hypothetical protein